MREKVSMAGVTECDGLRGGSGRPDMATRAAPEPDHPAAAVADLVHDLADLLTIVLGSLEQLRRQPLDARGQLQLDRAQWSARQAGLVTRRVLAASRGDAG